MKRLFLLSFVFAFSTLPLIAVELPQTPRSDRPIIDPNAYADACHASWPNDTRCRQACLQAAACATDDQGPCRNPILADCNQKRAGNDLDQIPTPQPPGANQ